MNSVSIKVLTLKSFECTLGIYPNYPSCEWSFSCEHLAGFSPRFNTAREAKRAGLISLKEHLHEEIARIDEKLTDISIKR